MQRLPLIFFSQIEALIFIYRFVVVGNDEGREIVIEIVIEEEIGRETETVTVKETVIVIVNENVTGMIGKNEEAVGTENVTGIGIEIETVRGIAIEIEIGIEKEIVEVVPTEVIEIVIEKEIARESVTEIVIGMMMIDMIETEAELNMTLKRKNHIRRMTMIKSIKEIEKNLPMKRITAMKKIMAMEKWKFDFTFTGTNVEQYDNNYYYFNCF